MPELRRFVWSYESLVDRLRASQPKLAGLLQSSCRPIAAERQPNGRLTLVLGCWSPTARQELQTPASVTILDAALKRLLDEPISVVIACWPGGNSETDEPPDPLRDLPEAERAIGATCGSAIHRAFFAAAFKRRLHFRCQYPVLHYRLDFALPAERLGVEIGGWEWRRWARGRAGEYREREQALGAEGWRILWFTGQEALEDPARCLDQIDVARRTGRRPRR